MTTKVKQGGVFVDLGSPAVVAPTPTPWVRPADWLPLPAVNVGEQKVVSLVPVYPGDSNFIALSCSGNYTVDWGDGSAPENIAAANAVGHNITYASVGNLTADGHRQAIITITPQAGANLTSVNLSVPPAGAPAGAPTLWLDVRMAGVNIANLTISGSSLMQQFEYVGPSALTICSFATCSALQSVIGTTWTSGITSFNNMFSYCTLLQTLPVLDTSAGTIFANMFGYCKSLQAVPLLNTSAGTGFDYMFTYCSSLRTIPLLDVSAQGVSMGLTSMFDMCPALQTIPLLDTAGITNFTSMFRGCSSLQTIPLLDTSAGTVFSNMFYGCLSLNAVPLLNTSAGLSFDSMFHGCSLLVTIPLLNTAVGTMFTDMFSDCSSLQTVPPLDTSSGVYFNYMFYNCSSLSTVPLLITSLGKTFSGMLGSCLALRSVPPLDTALGTNFSVMFYNCVSLHTLPLLNTAAGTNFSSMLTGCSSLSRGVLVGSKVSISYASCKLSGPELNAIYTALGSGVVGQTITVTGNWGGSTDTPSIATAKGWTVTGS